MIRSRINRVGKKPKRNWRLKAYLVRHRAKGCCELCGQVMKLWEHHIVKAGRKDYAWNLLILCVFCHNHHKYASGTELSKEQQLKLTATLNDAAGIDPNLNFGGVI